MEMPATDAISFVCIRKEESMCP